jgi:hypothetical protein
MAYTVFTIGVNIISKAIILTSVLSESGPIHPAMLIAYKTINIR